MRRGLSIFLVLFFGLGPLTATLQADDDMRLPPCCRRHGAHHCAMSDEMMARMVQAAPGSTHIVSAPSHCPLYPGHASPAVTSVHALVSSAAGMPVLLARTHAHAAGPVAASMRRIRAHVGRSPPSPRFC